MNEKLSSDPHCEQAADGEVTGRHYLTGKPIRIQWRNRTITHIEELTSAGSETIAWLAPGLFDVQVNGYGGIDFQRSDITEEEILMAARALRRDGCGRFFYTLITAEWNTLLGRLRRARELRHGSPELSTAIAGWHIEGPFLSDQPGFRGAHNAQVMRDPTPELMRELRDAAGNDPLLVTMAPERRGALEAIRVGRELNIVVSLGHTDASSEVIRNAVSAGATGFTHLANGCPRELNRHDNIVWRVCDVTGLTVSLIPDRIHVSPAPFRLMHRMLPAGSVFYTTDAMSAGGAGPGRYRLGDVEVEVGEDQIVRQPGQTNFAGSALRPIDGVFRAAQMLGIEWQTCWQRMSERPAEFAGSRNRLEVGAAFHVCAIHDPDAKVEAKIL